MTANGAEPGTWGDGSAEPASITDRVGFANELSRLRERAGKSIRALARELDQPPATIGGYCSGQHLPGVAQTEQFRHLLAHLGVTDAPAVDAWIEALVRVRARPGPRPGGERSPYRGLESFGVADAADFFGREALTAAVLDRASGILDGPGAGAIAVVGPSGSGKSSLLRAGVVAAATAGTSTLGPVAAVVATPGAEPLANLSRAVAERAGIDPAALVRAWRADPGAWPPPPQGGRGWLVVVDQLEELFAVGVDHASRAEALAVLTRAPVDGSGPLRVSVVGLRADSYDRAATEAALVPVLEAHQVVVGPMTVAELRSAIVGPARRAGSDVDPELVDVLVAEMAPRGLAPVTYEPGVLPLLSHALAETWARAGRNRMNLAVYRATGGVAGAVQQTAEEVYAGLGPGEQALARRLFLRLVHLDADGAVTRRHVRHGELAPAGGDRDGPAPLDPVIGEFVSHRLLTVEAETVAVSHEALLVAWPRLRDWVDADRQGLRVHRQLTEGARLWREAGEDPSLLLQGGRLEVVEGWLSSTEEGEVLNDHERTFLDASRRRSEEEGRALLRRTRRLQVLVALVATLAAFTAGLAVIASRARNDATRARDVALSRQVAGEASRLRDDDPALAAQLALAAYRISPTVEARSTVLDVSARPFPVRLLGQSGPTFLALAPDGSALVTTLAGDGSAQLFTLGDGPPRRAGLLAPDGSGAQLFTVAFSPDGATVATGGVGATIQLWDVADRQRPQALGPPLEGFTGPVQSVAFSPDGTALAGVGTAGGVLRWDLGDRRRPRPLAPLMGMAGYTQGLAFSPDGELVAAAREDSVVRLWRGTELVAALAVDGPTTVTSIAFSPDGRWLAAGSKDRRARLWERTGEGLVARGEPLGDFGSWVNAVAFTPDSAAVVAASSDNSVQLFDVTSLRPLVPALAHPGPVTSLAVTPDGRSLVTAAADGVTRLWPWPGPLATGADETIFALSYSADGQTLAAFPNRSDDAVRLWTTRAFEVPRLRGRVRLDPGVGRLSASGAVSPDGALLAAGTAEGRVALWDVTDPGRPQPLGPILAGSTDLVEQVAFSPDGGLLAATSDDGTVALWRVGPDGGEPLATLEGSGNIMLGLDFSPDGSWLAAGSADNRIWLWDVTDPVAPVALDPLAGFDNYVFTVAFSPDGRLLVAGGADRTVRLWDVADHRRAPRPVGPVLGGPTNYVYSLDVAPGSRLVSAAVVDGSVWQWDVTDPADPALVATLRGAASDRVFILAHSPDGVTLAVGDAATVRLWDTDVERVAEVVCATRGDAITAGEWARYLPDTPLADPCA